MSHGRDTGLTPREPQRLGIFWSVQGPAHSWSRADFNGTYGALNGKGTREHTFLFGPQVSLPAKVSPFAHALFGLASESQDVAPLPPCPTAPTCTVPFSLGSDTSFATAIGAGFDIKLAPFVNLRLIQVDYLRTQLHGATQNQARASAGIVFHF